MAIPLGAASPASLQLLHGLQYPLDVADLGDPEVPEVPPRQREQLASRDVMSHERVRVLTEVEGLEPRLHLPRAPGPDLGDRVRGGRTLGDAATSAQPATGAGLLW